MPDFRYCQGYKDAIMDLYDWFNMPERKGLLRTKGLTITALLSAFYKYANRFMMVKCYFNLDFIEIKKNKGKKEVTEIVIIPVENEKTEIKVQIDTLKKLKQEREDFSNRLDQSNQDAHKIIAGVYQNQIEELEKILSKKKMLLNILNAVGGIKLDPPEQTVVDQKIP